MYIHKEIIYVIFFVLLISIIIVIKFLLDFKRINRDIKVMSKELLSAKDYFFFHQFEPLIYNINSHVKNYQEKLNLKRLQILFYDKFFKSFPDPLFIIDEINQIIELNAKAINLVGNDAKTKNINSILRIPGLGELIEKSLVTKKPQKAELRLIYPVETVYSVWVSGASYLGDTYLNFIRLYDSTSEKKVHNLQTEFVANVSHELKTPVAAIVGYCETLLGVGKNDSDVREKFLKILKIESSRISSLVNDLLSLTRIERIEHTPPDTVVEMIDLLKDAINVSLTSHKIDKRMIKFFTKKNEVKVPGDYNELKQVFINIIDNSLKYGMSKKPLEIRLEDNKQMIKVTVQDFGQGIKVEDIPMLTNRFFRADQSRPRDFGSTGLGLSIVKHILNRHKTQINIESEVGKGSKFSVEFLKAF
jgi:two-component system, OmpR family, phosphate regulon sensor histidine kinase PhoR